MLRHVRVSRKETSGLKSASASSGINGLKDSNDFRAFVKENLSNPDFKEFGKKNGMKAVREMWYDRQIAGAKLFATSKEDAIATIRDNIPENILSGWFRNADSDYKPKLMDSIAIAPETYNAGLNVAYWNYIERTGKTMTFEKWLRTPQTLYRGDNGQKLVGGDVFVSYSTDRKIAEGFGKHITTIRLRPIDTWGSYQTTGEQEYLVPLRRLAARKK